MRFSNIAYIISNFKPAPSSTIAINLQVKGKGLSSTLKLAYIKHEISLFLYFFRAYRNQVFDLFEHKLLF